MLSSHERPPFSRRVTCMCSTHIYTLHLLFLLSRSCCVALLHPAHVLHVLIDSAADVVRPLAHVSCRCCPIPNASCSNTTVAWRRACHHHGDVTAAACVCHDIYAPDLDIYCHVQSASHLISSLLSPGLATCCHARPRHR